jgi:hypothetical protein
VNTDIQTIQQTDNELADTHCQHYVFYFFPTAHFLKTILATPQVAHLVLPDTQANASQNQKSHFFANAPTEICILVNYILTIRE